MSFLPDGSGNPMKNKFVDIIIEISDKIKSEGDFNALLLFIGEKLHDAAGFEKSSIVLYEGASLVTKVHKGYEPDKTVFSPEEWFTGENINPEGDLYIVDKVGKGMSVSFVLRSADNKVLGFMRGLLPEGADITEEETKFLSHCAFLTGMAAERHNLYSVKETGENLQIIGMLKSSVVHDISNILGIAEVYLELMEGEAHRSTALAEYIDCVKNELKRVDVIARDLLDFSKSTLNIHKEMFSLEDFAGELERYCKIIAKDTDINISFQAEKGLTVNADRDRLFRVFFNLINNAAEALAGRGRIWVRIKKTGTGVSFLVADNGKGIKKENIGRLFNPFFTSGKAKGSGLGLAVVRDIVQSHGGSVLVRSAEGKYTCFLIRIPR